MLVIPKLFFLRRKKRPTTPPAPVGPLTLVEATYDPGVSITLVFDRAIDVSGLDGNVINVDDGPTTGTIYEGLGPVTMVGPDAVEIGLFEVGPSESPGTTLTAGAGNGIVASMDETEWDGVSGLALPFP